MNNKELKAGSTVIIKTNGRKGRIIKIRNRVAEVEYETINGITRIDFYYLTSLISL